MILFFMGSISRQRLDVFLEAVRTLQVQGNNLRVIVAGAGSDLNAYRARYESSQLTFTGFVDDSELMRLLACADACYSDVWTQIGTPYKIIEYMAAGRAIITHRTPSIEGLLTDGLDSLLCEATAGDIENAIRRLLENPSLRWSLGTEARNKAVRIHEFDHAAALETEYQRSN